MQCGEGGGAAAVVVSCSDKSVSHSKKENIYKKLHPYPRFQHRRRTCILLWCECLSEFTAQSGLAIIWFACQPNPTVNTLTFRHVPSPQSLSEMLGFELFHSAWLQGIWNVRNIKSQFFASLLINL